MAIVRYGILNDVHFPYEGKAYQKAIKEMSRWDNLEHIFLNGDILEIESLSRHPKGPQAMTSYRKEIDYANRKFDEIQKRFPDIPVTLIEGNHCYRFFRYLRDVAPALWGVVEQPELLRFPERGWKFIPYGPRQWQRCGKSNLWLRHEPLSGGVNCARQTALLSDVDVLFGHTHIYQEYEVKRHGPSPRHIRAISGGWLGDIRQPIFDYRGSKDNWRNGFSEVTCDTKTGEYEYRFIRL